MKGYYRIYVQRRSAPGDWELVGSAETGDEAHAKALHWEQSDQEVSSVRVDVCVRYWHVDEPAAAVLVQGGDE